MDRQSFAELFVGMQSLVRPLLINVMLNDGDTHLINQLPVFGGEPRWQRITSLTPKNLQQAFLTLIFPGVKLPLEALSQFDGLVVLLLPAGAGAPANLPKGVIAWPVQGPLMRGLQARLMTLLVPLLQPGLVMSECEDVSQILKAGRTLQHCIVRNYQPETLAKNITARLPLAEQNSLLVVLLSPFARGLITSYEEAMEKIAVQMRPQARLLGGIWQCAIEEPTARVIGLSGFPSDILTARHYLATGSLTQNVPL
ncbi:hypothetical protein [Mangrovibacter yixingensis]|uniref:hypothetical protein n=1 Tax=Mangrovibacter yixingensis TaxID=1529639 RepID=UPI001CFB281E|nr:hypothetical protein [Mangrovibacter yixingensis]